MSTDMEKRKFYRFFTAFQVVINAHAALHLLRLGSMLNLYETDELEWIMWYTWHLHSKLDKWKEQLDLAKVKDEGKKKNDGKKKKGGGKKAPAAVAPKKIKVLTHLDMIRAAEAAICKGIYLTFLALKLRGLYVPLQYELQSERDRWGLRFDAMSKPHFAPVPVSYETFMEGRTADIVASGSNSTKLMEQAVDCYKLAKQKVESASKSHGQNASEQETQWLKSLTRVAVTNTLNLQTIKSTEPSNVVLDWSWNVFYPILKVVPKESKK
jgi:hypothetical protein